MGEQEKLPTPQHLAVNEIFGDGADGLREKLEQTCPHLVLGYDVDHVLLGFVPTFFYDRNNPEVPDALTRTQIISTEIDRFVEDIDHLASGHE